MTWAQEANAALKAELCRFFPHDWETLWDSRDSDTGTAMACSRCGENAWFIVTSPS